MAIAFAHNDAAGGCYPNFAEGCYGGDEVKSCQVWQSLVGSCDFGSDSLRARSAVSMAWTMVAAASPNCWSCTGVNGLMTSSCTRCA